MFLLVALPCLADQITLNNGKTISGLVEADQHGQVRVRTPEGLVTLPRSSVIKITRQTVSDNTVITIDAAAQHGDLAAVTALLQKLDPVSSGTARDSILAHADALEENARSQSSADVEAFALWCQSFPPDAAASLKLLVARLHTSRGETQQAAHLLLSLPTGPLMHSQQLRRRLASALVDCCEQLIELPHDELTSRSFSLLNAIETDAPTTYAATLLKLRASRNLALERRWNESIQILASSTSPIGAAQMRKQLVWVLNRTRQENDTTGTAAAGLAILNTFEDWFNDVEIADMRISTALALAQTGRYTEAQSIADGLSQDAPDAGAELQHRIEFLQKRAATGNADPLERYKLGVWARKMGLHEEASSIFNALRNEPVVAENALLQLQLLELEQGRKEIEGLTSLYKLEKYPEVITGIEKFRQRYSDPELTRRVSEIEQLAKYAQWNHGKRLPDQADAAFQNAQRLYNQGKFSDSVEQLNKVLLDYPKSAAAKQAAALRDKAIQILARSKTR